MSVPSNYFVNSVVSFSVNHEKFSVFHDNKIIFIFMSHKDISFIDFYSMNVFHTGERFNYESVFILISRFIDQIQIDLTLFRPLSRVNSDKHISC